MENGLIVVDTDAVIDFFSNAEPSSEVLSRLILRGEVALTSVSAFELYAGVEGNKRLNQIGALLQNVVVLPLDGVEAAMAGRIYTRLKSNGRLIGTPGVLIAGICLAHDLPLFTKNKGHFSRIEGLRLASAEEILKG